MTTDAGGVHRSECRTITEEIENDDLDSAIDLAKEIESLDKLQPFYVLSSRFSPITVIHSARLSAGGLLLPLNAKMASIGLGV
ncbi:unnamed protein product [Nippostrongylus brasiliensis]|uniref:Uncharacterized protein n=1 Tax=Nippostrongylus brasiliensis TaxID=27835 RepID=A0A0N4YHV5_NIPBR|nr:hypothetical protein Q1695_005597 [Nippostrongylus brasiliensis]VDL80061.1 unnamed protein product [Nippostrongylus brasiliensis]